MSWTPERRREWNREQYRICKEKGICVKCRKRPAEGGRIDCESCHIKPDEASRERERTRNKKLRDQVLEHYGNKCACCGVTERDFLAIDHVNNDGAHERKSIPFNRICAHIVSQGFPDTYQLLCHNCNFSKHLNGGVCVHSLPSGRTPSARPHLLN